MLKRLILFVLPLLAAEAPKPLTEAERLKVLTSQQKMLIAHSRKVEAQLAAAQAEQQLADLMRAHQALTAELKKKAGAADACQLDLEAQWQCESSPR